MLRGDFDAAFAAHDVHIATAGIYSDRNFARNGNIEIALYRMIPRALGHGVNRDQAADRRYRGLGLFVVLVGVILVIRAHALADDDGDLVVVGGMHAHRATRVNHFQAGSRGERLLQMIVEVVGLPEEVGEVAVVEIHLVAKSGPVHVIHLRRDQTKYDDHDGEEHSAGADAGSARAVALRSLMLEKFDHAPQNQQRRPVVGKQVRQPAEGHDAHGAQQADDAHHDQHERPGKRAARPQLWHRWHGRHRPESRSRSWRWTRHALVRHCSPRQKRLVVVESALVLEAVVHWAEYSVWHSA